MKNYIHFSATILLIGVVAFFLLGYFQLDFFGLVIMGATTFVAIIITMVGVIIKVSKIIKNLKNKDVYTVTYYKYYKKHSF